jgi:hypothetical protein
MYTIYPLVLAKLEGDRSLMTYRMHIGEKVWVPVVVWYIKGGRKNILVDTGASREAIGDHFNGKYGEVVSEMEKIPA